MAVVLFIAVTVVVSFHFGTSACPTHCKAGQTCDAGDSGCPECDPAYYGRQCQHRLECRFTTSGIEYRGLRNTTVNGRTCQRWTSQSPHKHRPDIVLGELNYCRNPDQGSGPWCYTTDPSVRWEYCDVKMCNTQCLSPSLNVSLVVVINPPSDGFALGFEVIIGCMTGYEAPATVTLTCQSDRTWTQSPLPACNRVQCSEPSLAENSQVSNPNPPYKYEDQITIVCTTGYTLQGQNTLTCQADKSWNDSVPACNINECSAPGLVPNASILISKAKYVYQDTVTIKCDTGYTLHGQEKLTCQADGTWSNGSTCKIAECTLPVLPATMKLHNPRHKYFYRDQITFSCTEGHEFHGGNTSDCKATAQWSEPFPICKKINCIELKLSSNVLISSPKKYTYSYEDKVSFRCEEGFKLSHDKDLICQANKLWNTEEPFCMEICNGLSTPQWVGITVGLNLANTLLSIFVTALFMRRFVPKAKKHSAPPASEISKRNAAFDGYDSIDVNAKDEQHIYNLPE